MKKIVIASRNPVKIKAVSSGFSKMFPNMPFEVSGISVSSGVSDQPMSNEETYIGAFNRARNASKEEPQADFWIGIEGGIGVSEYEMEAFAWVVVLSENQLGKARTASFFLPPEVTRLIRGGMELGDADDQVFGHSNSKQKNGAVGILTGDVITRAVYYAEAVVLALVPFKNSKLFPPQIAPE